MMDAPQCPKGCGPFGTPGLPEYSDQEPAGWVWCAACGYGWESAEDYLVAVRAEDEYLALEGVIQSQIRQGQRFLDDRKALADWEAWCEGVNG